MRALSAARGGRAGMRASQTRADQVAASGFKEGLLDLKIILGLEELEQGTLPLAVVQVLRRINFVVGERVKPCVLHAGGDITVDPLKTHRISGDRTTRNRDVSRGVR